MSIDPRNDRIVYYENIMDGFIEIQGRCDIRGAAEKIVELEERAAKSAEQPVDCRKAFEEYWTTSAGLMSVNKKIAGEIFEAGFSSLLYRKISEQRIGYSQENLMINECCYCIYMDRMSRMTERFKTLKEAKENWPTLSDDTREYYNKIAVYYLTLRSEE